jgi:hypothetical protein
MLSKEKIMGTTAFTTAPFAEDTRHDVGAALRALTASASNLAVALWNSAFETSASAPQELTPEDQAAQLRTMADEALSSKDAGFAQDLYAMADRVEREAMAAQIH